MPALGELVVESRCLRDGEQASLFKDQHQLSVRSRRELSHAGRYTVDLLTGVTRSRETVDFGW
jgi:hypothetical protein